MAFAGQIILSSSPLHVATPLRRSITPISSSPLLPSPSQLFAKKTANQKDTKALDGKSDAVIWANVSATDASNSIAALDHLREAANSISKDLEDRACLKGTKRRKEAWPKKSQARGEESETLLRKSADCKTVAQKRRSKSAVTAESSESSKSSDQTVLSVKQAIEKKNNKKSDRKSQAKIEGKRITKPGARSVSVTKKGKSASSAKKIPRSDAAPRDALQQEVNTGSAGKESLDLLLAEAVRRRRAWTPPKDTALEALDLGSRELDETLALETQKPIKSTSGGFENLLSDFGYAGKGEGSFISSDQGSNTNGEVVTKRRKLEVGR